MALRFFLDHCVRNSVAAALSGNGHETIRLREALPTDAPDPLVIAKAQEINALLLSFNGDFADIVSYPPELFKGIIALQVRNQPAILAAAVQRLIEYLQANPDIDFYVGKLVLVEPHRIRVRSSN